MNIDEAKRVLAIVMTADNKCGNCVRSLVAKLNDAKLGFHFKYDDATSLGYVNDERVVAVGYCDKHPDCYVWEDGSCQDCSGE